MSIDGHHSLNHPLSYLLQREGWSADSYLVRLDAAHQRLGYGPITRDRKKVTRWTRHGVVPGIRTQVAMARLHGVPDDEIAARPWPEWLRLACVRNRHVLDAEWTPAVTMELLARVAAGGPMDRRGFLVVAGVSPVLAGLVTAAPAVASTRGSRIGVDVPALFEQFLAVLRRQDDQLGSGQVHASARAQLQLIITTLKGKSYTDITGRRLYGAAAEAARICAWTAYDSGRQGLAEEYYVTALRAAASSGDAVTTANILGFWAVLRYATGDPRGGVDLVAEAVSQSRRIGSPKMDAMLYATRARAHSHAGEVRETRRSFHAAFEAFDRSRNHDAEAPDCVYWLTLGELHMKVGSCELTLGCPDKALEQFTQASGDLHINAALHEGFPRDAAIYLAREGQARVGLGDLDGAVDAGHRAVQHLGGVSSARGTTSFTDLRTQLANHADVPLVRDFLEQTA
ncbi:transcriptional regulator [Streptomyces tsukubensis]|uniref:transcriptional regulator n=1 Tax=Streptomyces tsukubensis TaxID=83656 RepID=UPI00344B7E14